MLHVSAIERVGIQKDGDGGFKGDAVLRRVGHRLPRVPLEHAFSIYGMGHAEADGREAVTACRNYAVGSVKLASIQQREEHRVIADLIGKGGHVRTVPMPPWVKAAVDAWTAVAGIAEGAIFRAINEVGRVWGDGMTAKVLWDVVRAAAAAAGIDKLAPHDLRRTCARLCHLAGGELDQIQFLLGHASIQTTERYPGCKQKLRCAVNDRLGIEPDAA